MRGKEDEQYDIIYNIINHIAYIDGDCCDFCCGRRCSIYHRIWRCYRMYILDNIIDSFAYQEKKKISLRGLSASPFSFILDAIFTASFMKEY